MTRNKEFLEGPFVGRVRGFISTRWGSQVIEAVVVHSQELKEPITVRLVAGVWNGEGRPRFGETVQVVSLTKVYNPVMKRTSWKAGTGGAPEKVLKLPPAKKKDRQGDLF